VATGVRLEAVAGGSGPSAEAATRDLGFGRVLESEDALIADPNVDAVVVATRHGSHADLSRRALEAGKHVFCEKPLAMSEEGLESVLEAASTSERVLMVGFNRRFAPSLRDLRRFRQGSARPVTATYRVSAGPLPADHWLHDLDQGGGRMIGEGCHFIDSLAFVVASPVTEVHATGYGQHGAPLQARDNLVVSLSFEDGSVATIAYVAQGSPRLPKERIELFASSGTGILDDYRSLELFGSTGIERKRGKGQDKGHGQEVADWVAGIRAGKNPISLGELRNVHLATFAAIESLRSGQPVTVDLPVAAG